MFVCVSLCVSCLPLPVCTFMCLPMELSSFASLYVCLRVSVCVVSASACMYVYVSAYGIKLIC